MLLYVLDHLRLSTISKTHKAPRISLYLSTPRALVLAMLVNLVGLEMDRKMLREVLRWMRDQIGHDCHDDAKWNRGQESNAE